MRKGFALIEMLFFVMVTPIVAVALSGVFAIFVRDIPQGARVLQQNTIALDMLQNVRRDMDRALALPQRFQGVRADQRTFLVELPEGTASYQFADGTVRRTMLRQDGAPGPQRVWRLPKAVVTWQPWKQGDTVYAVEVYTAVQQRIRAKVYNKLSNSHVFFLHGLGKDQAIK